ncbi:MAG: response regulator [Caulobacteraceae bacterium]
MQAAGASMFTLEKMLARSSRAPGEELYEAVAEPLVALRPALTRLLEGASDEAARADLQEIARAISAAETFLAAARDFRKAEFGRLSLDLQPRLLREAMDELEVRWRQTAGPASLLTSYDGDPECAAKVDWARLHQVLDALVGHAIARSEGGVIEASLRARADGESVILSCTVRGNGPGVTEEYLARFRAGEITPQEAGGARPLLAIALASHLIRAMGGELSASANAGSGATFAFEARLEACSLATSADESPRRAGGRGAHVLIVDDNATNRIVVEALCGMFDCSSESVADGIEAVEAARAGRFDVILMDIKMPRMDGLAATREIRRLPGPEARTPIIALTANADLEDARDYLAAGMQAVVEKPIKPDRLLEALDLALSAPPAQLTGAASKAA